MAGVTGPGPKHVEIQNLLKILVFGPKKSGEVSVRGPILYGLKYTFVN